MAEIDELSDDEPLTLSEACAIFFRNKIGPDSLRAAAKRGKVTIVRIGRTDFVTPAAIKGMMKPKCQEGANRPDSISGKTSKSGSSETERNLSAQGAALATAEALKKLSPATSRKNSSPSNAKVISLGSRLPKS